MEPANLPLTIACSFPCTEDAVEGSRLALLALLDPLDVDSRAVMRIEVVLEEMVSNVVRHSRQARQISITASWREGLLQAEVSDDGEPFDPLVAPAPQPFTVIEEARLGGLGIDLVRKMTTSLAYSRCDDGSQPRNCVSITMPAPRAG